MISRQKAEEFANQAIQKYGLGKKIAQIVSIDEITLAKPVLYGVDLEDCWIVYLASEVIGLYSSTIIVIRQDTGQVIYHGSANDEG